MREKLIHLSMLAHEQAVSDGTLTPAERREFGHLRMSTSGGVPYFDGNVGTDYRGRELTILEYQDLTERLEQIVGRRRAQDTYGQVRDYLYAYGRFGLRRADIVEGLAVSAISVRRACARLEREGLVRVAEEPTRGDGSPRKRYYWLNQGVDTHAGAFTAESLRTISDQEAADDSGIRYHGTAVQSVTCGCFNCNWAFDSWNRDQAASVERKRGGTGFIAHLDVLKAGWWAEAKAIDAVLARTKWNPGER